MIYYALAFFVIATFFPSFEFAIWTITNPPKRPQNDVWWTCTQWIEHHGFTLDNYDENRKMSKDRHVQYDKDASTFAAIYAFFIGSKHNMTDKLLPGKFCESFGTENNNLYPYTSLKNESRSCEKWILLYRFTNEHRVKNVLYAISHDVFQLGEISIWTFHYIAKLSSWNGLYFIKPSDFCAGVGKKVGQDEIRMPFMNVNGTLLTCKAWIELYEFSDDLDYNYEKAKHLNVEEEAQEVQCHYLPRLYASYLQSNGLSDVKINNMTPLEFCRKFISNDDAKEFGFLFGSDDVMIS